MRAYRFFRNTVPILGQAVLFLALALPAWAGQAISKPVLFAVPAIKADPVRNLVYAVDAGDNRLLEFDMTTGQVVASVAIDDGETHGEIAISQDDSTLYLSESGEDEIMVFSLPNLTPQPTLSLDFPPSTIACGAGGRLFATEAGQYSDISIVELNPSSGDIISTFGSSLYLYEPLLRTSADGTNLYVGNMGLSGYDSINEFSLAGGGVSAPTAYGYESENMEDFVPDDAEGRIYIMNGGIYGVNVLIKSNDNYSTVWSLTSAYGTAAGFSASQNVVYGGSGDPYSSDIREFSRTNGAPITDYVVGSSSGDLSVQSRGIAVAPNGNVFYVLTDDGYDETTCSIGIISSTGISPTLAPTVDSVITFPPPVADQYGDYTLSATDNKGLPITYVLVSGPADISGNELFVEGNGTIVIEAIVAGSAIYKPETKTITITVGPNSQTISPFAVVANQTCGVPFNITLPTASSGLAVTLSVQSGSATISGTRVTPTSAGVLTLAADQAGNSQYSSAPEVTTSIVVNKGSQTISSFGTIAPQYFGEAPITIPIPTSSAGLPVTVSVQSGPATLAGNKLTLTGVGTVVLAADQAGNSNYYAATEVTASVQVYGASQSIAPFAPIATKTYSTVPFAIIIPSATSGLPVTVSVQSGPATISGSTVTLTGTGVVELIANQGGNGNFAPAPSVSSTFAVNKATQTISAFATIAGVSYGVPAFNVTPPAATSGLTVTLSIKSGPATLSGNAVTVTGIGTVTLAADQGGNIGYSAAKEVTTTFAVGKATQSISPFAVIATQTMGVTPFTITLPAASSGLPVAVTVKSGPAKLSGNLLSISGPGAVTLSAAQSGNSLYAAAPTITTTFNVNKLGQTISAFATIPSHAFGDAPFTITLPTASSSLAVVVTVASGPAKISRNTITLTGAGTVVLAANQVGSATIAAATPVTTSFSVSQAAQSIGALATIPAKIYGAAAFSVTTPKATSKLPVTLSILSGPATIASGRVTITGVGTVVIAANQAGNASYLAAPELTTSFTVSPANQTIAAFRSIPKKSVGAAPFTITIPAATSKLPVAVNVQSGPATISGNVVTVTGAGVVTLVANQPGNANYNAAPTVTTTFTVQ